MENLQISFQNILDGQGGGIALTGMSIVFTALGLISLFIALLPRLLEKAVRFLPESAGHGVRKRPREEKDDTEIVAAIAFALHTQMRKPLADR
jgi:oxaloacetate decarboxylase gamma subunit